MDGLKRQPEPLQDRLTEDSDNLFLVYFFCMADAVSCRPAARRAPPDRIVPISVCHMEKAAALPADKSLGKRSRLLAEFCPVI